MSGSRTRIAPFGHLRKYIRKEDKVLQGKGGTKQGGRVDTDSMSVWMHRQSILPLTLGKPGDPLTGLRAHEQAQFQTPGNKFDSYDSLLRLLQSDKPAMQKGRVQGKSKSPNPLSDFVQL